MSPNRRMRAISAEVRPGNVCSWRGNVTGAGPPPAIEVSDTSLAAMAITFQLFARQDPAPIQSLAVPANLPIWRGFTARGGRLGWLAALALLRFAPFEVFAQRELEPIPPRVLLWALAFARPIRHVRTYRFVMVLISRPAAPA